MQSFGVALASINAASDKMNVADILQVLPAATYTTDSAGFITAYNEAALALWGAAPVLGEARYCGPWTLYQPDHRPLAHDQSPTAIALKARRALHGVEVMGERADGACISFLAYPTPLFNDAGDLVGAVSMLIDITERKADESAARRLAAIIASSDDAILAKNLDGVITDWNDGATRLFGYTAEEAVGRSVTMLIPVDRHDEEPEILARIRRGERIEHYETVRQHKDGSRIDISLTVSPILNRKGEVIGASKIARDISDRRRAEEQKDLLLREMNHRIKNLFAISSSLVNVSARHATTVDGLAADLQGRFTALANAHTLTLTAAAGDVSHQPETSLHALIRTIVSPYRGADRADSRVNITGPDWPITGSDVTAFALLLHEFATNAAKYGALSTSSGGIDVECLHDADQITLIWRERCLTGTPQNDFDSGFGSVLIRATVEQSLGGQFERMSTQDGLELRITFPRKPQDAV